MKLRGMFSRLQRGARADRGRAAGLRTSSTEPPTGYSPFPDPDAFDNEQGTVELYRGRSSNSGEATSGKITPGGYITMSGLLGDELSAGKLNTPTCGRVFRHDGRG